MDGSHRHLALITGASGALGQKLMEAFRKQSETLCVGISRDMNLVTAFNTAAAKPANITWHCADIGNPRSIKSCMENILDMPDLKNVTFIHAAGPFLYEGYKTRRKATRHQADPSILQLNALCMEQIAQGIIDKFAKSSFCGFQHRVRLCTFGSISEPYEVPLWHSFNLAKKRAHDFLRNQTAHCREIQSIDLSSLYMRTSSINMQQTPKNDAWLEPEEVACSALMALGSLTRGMHMSIDIFKPQPAFDPAGYYADIPALDAAWQKRYL